MKPYSVKYLSPASQNEFISLLADDVKSRIARDMNSAGIYSVMADTSPDSSNTDRLVVAVRYVDEENSPRERVLEMKEAIDKTGQGQAKEILDSLNSRVSSKSELYISHMIIPHQCQGVSKKPNSSCTIWLVAAFHTSLAKPIGN